jgi:hypothetical protein
MFAELVRNIKGRRLIREIGILRPTQSQTKTVSTNSTGIFSGSAITATMPLTDFMLPNTISSQELENFDALLCPLIDMTYREQHALFFDEPEEDDDWA